MATAAGQTKDGLSFGPFNLIASERLLTKGGAPVELGGRALDILIVLISTPNEVVSKKDLMSRVWPDVIVEEGSLRFHMASLRKALGDGKNGARYITTLAGRGYCFVAPVSQAGSPRDEAPVAPASFPHANLPNRLGRMVGRDDDVQKLSAQLSASRLVTIVGPGGVGKTTVAVAVAHHLADAFAGSVLFVDLGMLSDPKLATTAVVLHAGAVGPVGRCNPWADCILEEQANSADPRYLRASRRRDCRAGRKAHGGRTASPHPRHQPRSAPDRGRAYLQTGCARLSTGCPGADRGGGSAVSGSPTVPGARGRKRRPFGRQRCGSAHCRRHLPEA